MRGQVRHMLIPICLCTADEAEQHTHAEAAVPDQTGT